MAVNGPRPEYGCSERHLSAEGTPKGFAFLQPLLWLVIANSPSTISIFTISIYLLLSNLGTAIVEVANDAIVAALSGTMFFYQTEHLQINSSVLGISKVFGQATMLLWGIIYNHYLKFYVVIFLEVLFFFKILPFSVLIA